MAWVVERTDEMTTWYEGLSAGDQAPVEYSVAVLAEGGPSLGRPHVDTVNYSRHRNMKELRVQSSGRPLRVFFAFDKRRVAVLLIGGDKTGSERFYETLLPQADNIYDNHLSS